MRPTTIGVASFVAIAIHLGTGCSSKSADKCIIGTDGCLCFGNDTCDPGFECNASSKLCLAPGSASSGGSSGSGNEASGGSIGGQSEQGAGGTSSGGSVVQGGMPGVSGGSSESGGAEPLTGGTSSSAGDGSGGASSPAGGVAGTTSSVSGGVGGLELGGAGGVGVGGGGGVGVGGGGGVAGSVNGGSTGFGGAGGSTVVEGTCAKIGFIGDDQSTATGAAPDQLIEWLESLGATVTRIDANDPLSDELLAPLHLAIVGNMSARSDASNDYSADDIDVMTAWVEEGGGLLTLAGYTGDELAVKPASDLLSALQLGYDYAGRGAGVLGDGDPPMVIEVSQPSSHPVTLGVANVGVYYVYPTTGSGTALFARDEFTLAMAQEHVGGRAIAFSDDYISLVSDWPNHADLDQETLMRNMLDWLLESSGCTL